MQSSFEETTSALQLEATSMNEQESTSSSVWTSTLEPICGSSESMSVTPATVEAVPSTSRASTSSSLAIDPEKLVFQLGQSPSKIDSMSAVKPQSYVTLVTSTSLERSYSPSLFNNYIQSASNDNIPRRFHFDSKSTEVTSTTTSGKHKQPVATSTNNALPSRFRQSERRMPQLPTLGPDITIRPIIRRYSKPNHNETNHMKINPHKQKLNNIDIHKLTSGYNLLLTKVDMLQSQLADTQTLYQDIFDTYSTELGNLNTRISTLEQKIGKDQSNDSTQENIGLHMEDLTLAKSDEDELASD